MTELGIGLVGCGRWGQLLARMIQELDGARIVAVQNRTSSRGEAFASSLGVAAYATYQELFADPNVRAVLVVNPPHCMKKSWSRPRKQANTYSVRSPWL